MTDETARVNRRQFLRRAAATTAAAAWATPLIQSIAVTPAYADSAGTPVGQCSHSNADPSMSCMDACTGACAGITDAPGDRCNGFGDPNGPCAVYCNISPGNQCPNTNFCNPGCFQCNADSVTFICATA